MTAYIDAYRGGFGAEPICKVLQIAPSNYWRHAARRRNPELRSDLSILDERRMPMGRDVWDSNLEIYGADKCGHQLNRESEQIARCTVELLMKRLRLRGARGGVPVRTTYANLSDPRPQDNVNRQFKADRINQLWVSDFTYVSTWQGWLYVASVVDVFARQIVGWRVSKSMQTDFAMDALEQTLFDRHPEQTDKLINQSGRGARYVSIRYTERLAQAGIAPSVGSRGDSYDNALAETRSRLYKAELIHRRALWRTRETVELATLEGVHWFNHHRLLESIGYVPPPEATIYTQVIAEIKRQEQRGERPRLVQHGHGYVGLGRCLGCGLVSQIAQRNHQLRKVLHERLLAVKPGELKEVILQSQAEMEIEMVEMKKPSRDGAINVRDLLAVVDVVRI